MIGLKIYFLYKSTKEQSVFLEITPPYDADQSSYSTEQLFTTLHSLGMQMPYLHRLLGKNKLFSLELVSTKNAGIRFLLRTNSLDATAIERNIAAYLPGVTLKKVSDYLPENQKDLRTIELRLNNNFVLPLQKQSELSQHDPIAYITGHMTKLTDGELVSYQIILTPLRKESHVKETKLIKELQRLMYKDIDVSAIIKRKAYPFPANFIIPLLTFCINGFVFCLLTPFTLFDTFLFGGKSDPLPIWLFTGMKPKYQRVSDQQVQMQKMIGAKIGEELFETTIRITLIQKNAVEMQERLKGLVSTFSFYTNAGHQALILKRPLPFLSRLGLFHSFRLLLLKYRLLSFSQNPVLSVTELSSLYHLPYFATTKTEDVIKRRSTILPAPLQLKQTGVILDTEFAKNSYGNKEIVIGLTAEERYRHMYILGATGTGKTTLLATMIHNDIQNGKGICVIDPHGDLVNQILGTIPKHRIKDVVYFNPLDRNFPIGLNVLELPEGLSEEQKEIEKDIITSSIISIFHKLYSEKYLGPRMEHILRFTILTALETNHPTLFTIQRILTDDKYRAKIVSTLKDPVVKDFWLNEFKKFGSYQKADAISPITNKLGRFLSSPLCRNILGQSRSTVNFEDILHDGKVLLCDLSKGRIGEDNSTFFGTLITAKIQLAALQREKIPEQERREFYLYIDEFQNFATPSFAQIMSEARKYGLYAILAHQTISQLADHDITKTILANTGTVICFRTSSPLDEEYILPIFSPHVAKGDIANLPSFSFYIKNNAIEPKDTFSGEIVPFPYNRDELIAQEIQKYSQQTYGVLKQQVVADIEKIYAKQPQTNAPRNLKPVVKPSKSQIIAGNMV